MKKNDYQKPAMQVVKIQQALMLCASITGTKSNVGITGGNIGSSGEARSRSDNGGWFDDEE